MKPNPDNRHDNVEKLETAIQNTKENIEAANEAVQHSSAVDQELIHEKNERRKDSIVAMEEEICDEKQEREHGFK